MKLADLKSDNDYLGLPETERAKVVEHLTKNDTDFHGLDDTEKVKVLNHLVGMKAQPVEQPKTATVQTTPETGKSYSLENPFAEGSTPLQNLKENATSFGKGLVSGAADIGNTLVNASTYIPRKIENIAGSNKLEQANASREEGLKSFNKENEGDIIYGGGRLAGNIAGTAGVGGAAGLTLKAASKTPRAAALADSIASSGLTGTTVNKVLGSGVSAGLGTLLIDPEDTVKGAAIGAAVPIVGAAASKLIKPRDVEKVAQVKDLQSLGYRLPPQDVQAGVGSQVLNAVGGKVKTEQKASLLNQSVTNNIVAKDLGLPQGEKITKDTLSSIRKKAGQDYAVAKNFGDIEVDDAYKTAISNISDKFKGAAKDFPELVGDDINKVIASVSKDKFSSSSAIDAIGILRDKADKAYRDGDKQLGKATKDAANALEGMIERHLSNSGASDDVIKNYQASRKLIAKTYTIEKALNDATGNIDARKLAKALDKGVPLDGEVKKVAQFGKAFPKSAQEVQGVNPYSILDANVGGAAGLATMFNPATAPFTAGLAATVASRPAARNIALSPMYQKAFVNNKESVISKAVKGADKLNRKSNGAIAAALNR